VGIGDPLEAEYPLVAAIPAGTWHLVADGVIIEPVDVQFELIWRGDAGDQVIASFQHHFDPNGGGNFDAVAYEDTADADAVPAAAGDQLVLRFSAMNATLEMAYIPNGDGAQTHGRIPFIELPQ
jgi:hypothetical protein